MKNLRFCLLVILLSNLIAINTVICDELDNDEPSSTPSPFKTTKSSIVILNENNWRTILRNEWMVEFYAPWCPACKNLAPTWELLAKWAGNGKISVAKIDVTTAPALSGRFFVTALPTIFHVKDGEFRQYRGSRNLESLQEFVENMQWEKLEKISEWKHPDSIQMTVVSYFFKLSHLLKELNNQLLKEYGLPVWASYAIFAIGTILIGAILGLILVCIIDFLFPPKMATRLSFSEVKEKELLLQQTEGDDIDIRGDELEDEGEEDAETSDEEKYSGSDSDAVPESDKKKITTRKSRK